MKNVIKTKSKEIFKIIPHVIRDLCIYKVKKLYSILWVKFWLYETDVRSSEYAPHLTFATKNKAKEYISKGYFQYYYKETT